MFIMQWYLEQCPTAGSVPSGGMNIHCADNNALDPKDKFAEVNPLFDCINAACLANFQSEQTFNVDESMISYYGRHGANQYMHGKSFKFGYKMCVLATHLGYVVKFCPYQGVQNAFQLYCL